MIFRGRGLKNKTRKLLVAFIKKFIPPGFLYDTSSRVLNFKNALQTKQDWGELDIVYPASKREERLPEIYNYKVTQRFARYQVREIPEAYIVTLHDGRISGVETNFILSSQNILSKDLSREFGAYGGKNIAECSLLTEQLWYGEKKSVKGKIAVITTRGSNNFHHWNYDSIPRIHLLKEAGLLEEIDFFIITHTNLSFQMESLRLLNIPSDKIINPNGKEMLITAEMLLVPSLPSVLGTVSPWVVGFLRNLYNPDNLQEAGFEKIYVSRKNVRSRHIVNNDAFLGLLKRFGIRELFPEDYSVTAFSRIIAGSRFIISVHGSGLSNICFSNKEAVVVDILAPYHQDAYYWLITNICSGRYIGFFANGSHPADNVDLVKHKIDDDVFIDIEKLEQLLVRELN